MVAIPGGEPLIHKEIGEIVKGIVARKKFVSLCTNALLLEKKLHLFEPSPYLFFSVHLDGLKEHHDKSVCMEGVFEQGGRRHQGRARPRASPSTSTARSSTAIRPRTSRRSSTSRKELGVGVSISPGYAYERAPDQQHFLNRRKTKELFRKVFARGKGKNWKLHPFRHCSSTSSPATRNYHCTPWGMPTRNVFGWQKPCYLLGEGYAKTFKELMETTDWDAYGTGRYEKCANCMAHCGYEPTAAEATLEHPLKALALALRGVQTEGPMAPEIPLDNQRPAQYVFDGQVQQRLSEIRANEAREKARQGTRRRTAASAA